ncbi:MAG: hypothetical protein ACE5I1_07945 [bacterium]
MAKKQSIYLKIKEIINQYLLENIGEMAISGVPRYDENHHRWLIPILCETSKGILPGGRIELDENLNFVYATPRDDMVKAVEAQLRRLPFLVFAEEDELKAKGIEPVTL